MKNILISKETLSNTPSRRDGVSNDIENTLRSYGTDLIQRAGILLRLQQVTASSAQIALHRFYYRRSLREFDVRVVCAATLYVACKLQEEPRRVQHIINVLTELIEEPNDCDLLDRESEVYKALKKMVFQAEHYILLESGFMISQAFVHPHRYVLQYIHALIESTPSICKSDLSAKAWAYLNDSLRTTLCCEVSPHVIAVGCIYLAACDCLIPLPQTTRWYEIFDVTWEDICRVCVAINSYYYQFSKPRYIKLNPFNDPEVNQSEADGPADKAVDFDTKHRVPCARWARWPHKVRKQRQFEEAQKKAPSEPPARVPSPIKRGGRTFTKEAKKKRHTEEKTDAQKKTPVA
eukprot:GHVO01005115.1.p1 GENE.GHVO01005115.1~~GHVO01005115.1.p1  ORF type:complete len:364 (-),score=40.61 GHVO01005115.1:367-1413(-)